MSQPKKILFLSCSAGTGHVRAAEALYLTCRTKYPQIKSAHIDIMDYSGGLFGKSITSSYHFLARHLPNIYGLLYQMFDFSKSPDVLNKISLLLKINLRKFNKFIKEYQPDQIFCTHFLASAFANQYADKIPIDFLITDYEINKVCLAPQIRYFFTPSNDICDELKQMGRQAFYTGIPIHPEFLKEKNINELKNKWRINNDWPTILILTGGIGLIDPVPFVKEIINDFKNINLIIVVGKNNKKIFKELNKFQLNSINYRVITYTTKIDELMRLADVILTKPGGLSVTETLFLQKPALLSMPIPGQEEANVRFVEKNNYGRQIPELNKITDALQEIIRRPDIFTKPNLSKLVNEKILKQIFS
ncbi:MAG: hypothetical protein COU29_02580 [Candidatus Magasanikbacteria bacterium CG10_big_fil_rev_8_21_14_0_10_36_32]|uniref:Diacylglycerol glucosyltransferase N-terminal domain-containing protein n=1 Tax=Candidatus Magasanikbacteria bacterium CG10_big_fil_rev_8_21_14_0_10_36_32 TaxID=1974646 RepID=A0A2M6W784_9BACT|nr:MAG: hypothetical protein COU29_02580 [Candidatus Magasanikbacteria bacterium CG10_big_fil_rev_8_21_14_0_10_36_32]